MAQQYFVLGIGGTGMRCIESLIHLCAMGMFDDTVVHLLALDTDKNNGNFARLKAVKEAYVNAKSPDKMDRRPLKETFFSADIRYYEFSPNYEQKSSFKQVFNYGNAQYNSKAEADLADLVLTQNVEEFDLKHGYRAQTHLGSMMMYHSIVEAVKDPKSNDLKSFLQELINATQSATVKVFILGSVFGGTGASSIPIIPQAISDAAGVLSGGAANILQNAYFGSTLLTAYFNFKAPSGDQLIQDKIVATSDKFALNSQVAMMFYDDDTTVKRTYQKLYMIGTDNQSYDPMASRKDSITKTITGGAAQKNDSHYIELMAACAALDFYHQNDDKLAQIKQNGAPDYLYRAIGDNDKLEFRDFVDDDKAFAARFGMLIAFVYLCNGPDDVVESSRNGSQKEIVGFNSIDPAQVIALKDYFKLFFVDIRTEEIVDGWLMQLNRSAGGGDNFLFNASVINVQRQKGSKYSWNSKFPWNKCIYRNDGIAKDWQFSTGLTSNAFDKFKKEFINQNHVADIPNAGERFYKTTFNTLRQIFNIK